MQACPKQFGCIFFQMALALVVCALPAVSFGVPAGGLLDDQVQGSAAAGVTPKAYAQLPLDAKVVDEYGTEMKLGEFFNDGKPTIFMLVYYSCPNLCNVELNSLVESMKDKEMRLRLGEQFNIVTLSFSDMDTPELARVKKSKYMDALGATGHEHAWHFLCGTPQQVKRIADAVGCGYVRNYNTGDYMHGAAVFICTPDGRVSRTIQDSVYSASELRDSLIYASDGKIASPIFRVAQTCGIIEYKGGRYTWVYMGMMRIAGLLTMLFLGTVIGVVWYRAHRAQRNGTLPPNTNVKLV